MKHSETISQTEFKRLAYLHAKGIQTGFISTLGEGFIAAMYSALNDDPSAAVLVIRDDYGTIQGFISGTYDTAGLYKRVLKKNALQFSLILLPTVFNPLRIIKIFQTIFYGFFAPSHNSESVSRCESELLSMAVDSAVRGKGHGKKLVGMFEEYLKSKNVNVYKVVTFSEDPCSNNFYRSCGFTLHQQFRHHGNLMNEYRKNVEMLNR